MKQLTEQELNAKIERFLDSRMKAHPDLQTTQVIHVHAMHSQSLVEKVVSRVKNIPSKLNRGHSVVAKTLYQS